MTAKGDRFLEAQMQEQIEQLSKTVDELSYEVDWMKDAFRELERIRINKAKKQQQTK